MPKDEPPGQAAEAARYAILRRVGPALRHDLIVNLQALAMTTEVAMARLDKGLPPLADLQLQLSRIQRGTRQAVTHSLRVATWLAPPEDDSIDLREGIEQCLALVRSGLEFRGFAVRAELPPSGFEVSSAALRPLLLAALIHLTDQAGVPGPLQVCGQADAGQARLALSRTASGGNAVPSEEALNRAYRRLEARDVQALADAAAAELRMSHDQIAFRLPRLVPTTPLQIAPT